MPENRKPHPLVELVKSWEVYDQQHPDGSVEDFCAYLLASRRPLGVQPDIDPESVPMGVTNALAVTIIRLHKFSQFYSRKVMQELPVDNTEDFFYMMHLHFEGAMRKSELIARNISEFTSGTNVINRLLKHGLIEEQDDLSDARSKQVRTTAKGQEWIQHCLPGMINVFGMLLGHLSEEEQQLAYQILSKADAFHTQHYPEFRQQKASDIRQRLGKD